MKGLALPLKKNFKLKKQQGNKKTNSEINFNYES